MIWEIYAYWNNIELKGIFSAIAMITTSADYLDLIFAMFLIGLFAMGLGALVNSKDPSAGWRWFIISIFLYLVLVVPKADVAILDRTGTSPAITVSNVPLSVAVLGHVTSKVGDWLTSNYETAMTIVTPSYTSTSGITFQDNGLLFGHKILDEAHNINTENTSFQLNMTTFFQQCVFPQFDTNRISPQDVFSSNDLWGELSGKLNPAIYITMYDSNSYSDTTPTPCTDAYNLLGSQLATQSNNEIGRVAKKLYPDQTSAVARNSFEASLAGTYGFYTGVSENAVNIFKQRLAANTFLNASRMDSTQAFAVSQAEVTARTNYSTLSEIAQSTIPKLRNVAEVIIYSVFPIILIIMVLAGEKALLVIKNYLVILMSIQLWAPLYAVMNYMMSSYTQKTIQASMNPGSELSVMYAGLINAGAQSDLDIAGMLAMSIPVLALAIMKGGEMAMTSAMSGMSAPASQAAAAASREVAMGNLKSGTVALDTSNYNTHSSNKMDMQPSMNNGALTSMGRDGIQSTTYMNSDGTFGQANNTSARENVGALSDYTVSAQQTSQFKSQYEEATKATNTTGAAASASYGDAIQYMAAQGTGYDTTKAAEKAFGTSEGAAVANSWSKMRKAEESLANSTDISGIDTGKLSEYVGAQMRAGTSPTDILSMGISAEAGFKATRDFTEQEKQAITESFSEVSSEDVSNTNKFEEALATNDSVRDAYGYKETGSTEEKAVFDASAKYNQEHKASLEKQEAAKESWETSQQETAGYALNVAKLFDYSRLNDAQKNLLNGGMQEEVNTLLTAEQGSNEYWSAYQGIKNSMGELDAAGSRIANVVNGDSPGETTRDAQSVEDGHQQNVSKVIQTDEANREAVGAPELYEDTSTTLANQKGKTETAVTDKKEEVKTGMGDIKADVANANPKVEKPGGEELTKLKDSPNNPVEMALPDSESNPDHKPPSAVMPYMGSEQMELNNANKKEVGTRDNGEVDLLMSDRGYVSDNTIADDDINYSNLREAYNKGEFTKDELAEYGQSGFVDDGNKKEFNNFVNNLDTGDRGAAEVAEAMKKDGLYEDNTFGADKIDYDGIREGYENGDYSQQEIRNLASSSGFDDGAQVAHQKFVTSLNDVQQKVPEQEQEQEQVQVTSTPAEPKEGQEVTQRQGELNNAQTAEQQALATGMSNVDPNAPDAPLYAKFNNPEMATAGSEIKVGDSTFSSTGEKDKMGHVVYDAPNSAGQFVVGTDDAMQPASQDAYSTQAPQITTKDAEASQVNNQETTKPSSDPKPAEMNADTTPKPPNESTDEPKKDAMAKFNEVTSGLRDNGNATPTVTQQDATPAQEPSAEQQDNLSPAEKAEAQAISEGVKQYESRNPEIRDEAPVHARFNSENMATKGATVDLVSSELTSTGQKDEMGHVIYNNDDGNQVFVNSSGSIKPYDETAEVNTETAPVTPADTTAPKAAEVNTETAPVTPADTTAPKAAEVNTETAPVTPADTTAPKAAEVNTETAPVTPADTTAPKAAEVNTETEPSTSGAENNTDTPAASSAPKAEATPPDLKTPEKAKIKGEDAQTEPADTSATHDDETKDSDAQMASQVKEMKDPYAPTQPTQTQAPTTVETEPDAKDVIPDSASPTVSDKKS